MNETTEDSLINLFKLCRPLPSSVLNSIALFIASKCIYRVVLHRISQASLATTASQPTVTLQERSSNIEPPQTPRYIRGGPIRKQLPSEQQGIKHYLIVGILNNFTQNELRNNYFY